MNSIAKTCPQLIALHDVIQEHMVDKTEVPKLLEGDDDEEEVEESRQDGWEACQLNWKNNLKSR